MAYTFQYGVFELGNGERVLRPVISALIGNAHDPECATVLPFIIDSGADNCMLSSTMAELIGHEFGRGCNRQRVSGIGPAPVAAERHQCVFEIRQTRYECDFLVIENRSLPYGLLGQRGFFDRFRVDLNQKNRLIRLFPYG